MSAPEKGSTLDTYWRKALGVGPDMSLWEQKRNRLYIPQLAKGQEPATKKMKIAQDRLAKDQKKAAAKLKASVAAKLAAAKKPAARKKGKSRERARRKTPPKGKKPTEWRSCKKKKRELALRAAAMPTPAEDRRHRPNPGKPLADLVDEPKQPLTAGGLIRRSSKK